MQLQKLLDETNKAFNIIQLNHRNSLSIDDRLHYILNELKEFFYGFIDNIGEDIVINGDFAQFNTFKLSDTPTDYINIFIYSRETVFGYINILVDFYQQTDDEEIKNAYIDKCKELRKLYTKLLSICREEIDEMDDNYD